MDGSRPAALSGVFSDFKIVKTRAVCQIIVEIPIERADDALAVLGGVPRADREVPVALARLRAAPEPERVPAPPRDPESIRPPAKSEKARQAYLDKDEWAKARDRAAMLCGKVDFQRWLRSAYPEKWTVFVKIEHRDEDVATRIMREVCEILSRREIGTSERAFLAFKKLEDAYQIESKYGDQLNATR